MTATVKLMAQRTGTQLSKIEVGEGDGSAGWSGLDPGFRPGSWHLARCQAQLRRTLTNTLSYAFEDVNLMSSPLYTQR